MLKLSVFSKHPFQFLMALKRMYFFLLQIYEARKILIEVTLFLINSQLRLELLFLLDPSVVSVHICFSDISAVLLGQMFQCLSF